MADEEVTRALHDLNDNMSRLLRYFNDGGDGGSKTKTKTKSQSNRIDSVLHPTLESIKVLRGTTDDLKNAARSMVSFGGSLLGVGAAAKVFDFIVDAGKELTSSYHKLSDVGQTFGGSIFKMAETAGNAGLSLDEFARTLERNSTVAAMLQGTTSKSLGDLDKSVRNNLRDFGFYGMTLSQLDDATGDYMETLLKSGNIFKLTDMQRQSSVKDIVEEATRFSKAFGKSREEVLKNVKEHMQNPNVTAQLAGKPAEQHAFNMALTGITTMSKSLGDTFAQVKGGNPDYVLANLDQYPLLKAAQMFGRPDIIQDFVKISNLNSQGLTPSDDMIIDLAKKFLYFDEDGPKRTLDVNARTQKEYVDAIRQVLNDIRGPLGSKEAEDRIRASLREDFRTKTDLEKLMLTFNSDFHGMIGKFDSGFFKSFGEGLIGKSGFDKDGKPKWAENFGIVMEKIGGALGDLLSRALVPANVEKFIKFTSNDLPSVINAIADVFSEFAGFLGGLHEMNKNLGMNEGRSWLSTLAEVFVGFKMVKWFGTMLAAFFTGGAAAGGAGAAAAGIAGLSILRGGMQAVIAGVIVAVIAGSIKGFSIESELTAAMEGAALFGAVFGIRGAILGAIAGFLVKTFVDAEKRLTDPSTYDKNSPFWRGMSESDQLKYKNSPASMKAIGDGQYNPNPYNIWNPGSWLNQKPEMPNTPGFAIPSGYTELVAKKAEDERLAEIDRNKLKSGNISDDEYMLVFADLKKILTDIRDINLQQNSMVKTGLVNDLNNTPIDKSLFYFTP